MAINYLAFHGAGQMDAKFDWKTKWQKKTRGGSLIQRVGELPFPFPNGDCLLVEVYGGAVYTVKESGRYRGTVQSDLDLIPIPPKPKVVYWSKPEDMDPLIERIRGIRSRDICLGLLPVWKDCDGIHCVAAIRNRDLAQSWCIAWNDMKDSEYRRIGCPIWRPCTTTSEGV
jgi:hypothetical protein